jgi:hypothetical protein
MLDRTTPFFSLIAVLLAAACSGDRSELANDASGAGGSSIPVITVEAGADAAVCAFGQIVCEGDTAKTCDGKGGFMATKQCGTQCSDGIGCVQCMPNAGRCAFNLAKVCDPSGTQEVNFVCNGPGMECTADGCTGVCSPTTLGMSYRGCEFWPTVTANSVWSDRTHLGSGGFHFGVLLGNDSDKTTAHVVITLADKKWELDVAPGQVAKEMLDWVPELKGADWDTPFIPSGPTQSVNKINAAYHVVSNSPIIAYQFSAMEGRLGDNTGCPMLPGTGGGCYSYSNDASLLIPAHALSSNYVVSGYHAWHSDHFSQSSSGKLNMGDFVAITATTHIDAVTITLAPNQGVLPWGTGLPRFGVGESTTFPMEAGQVVQLFTPGATENETLAGTVISAKSNRASDVFTPLQVISGMGCASIPEDASPCGHVEDPVLPLEMLGKDYVVPYVVSTEKFNAPAPVAQPQTIRIQAISDGTALTFEPTKYNAVTLNKGEVLELPNVVDDLRVTSTTPFAVTQFLNGRGDFTKATVDGKNVGGPSQLSVPPTTQFRTDYSFIASPLYDSSYVSIVAPTGTAVTLDTQPIPAQSFAAVGATGMSVTRQQLKDNDKVHLLHSDKPVGIFIFGYNPYSNYLYAGGFDLKRSSAATVK